MFMEPLKFEEKWGKLIENFDLQNHKWMTKMFNLQEIWIPAYFIDFSLFGLTRTTSRSESENSFFKSFTSPGSMLVHFMMSYESAIERQRYRQEALDFKTIDAAPKCGTKLAIERPATRVYTRTVFLLVQKEIIEGEEKMGAFVEKLKLLKDEVKADVPNPPSRNTRDVIGGFQGIARVEWGCVLGCDLFWSLGKVEKKVNSSGVLFTDEKKKASTSKGAESPIYDATRDENENESSFNSEGLNYGGFTKEEMKALRSMINKQVGKAIKSVIPYYISQTTDNLKEVIIKELEVFKKGGIMNDYRDDMATYHDFTACDVPKFDEALDPIASTRWLAAVEGAFRTSNYKEKNKVNFASNFLRDSGKMWWEGKVFEKGEEWIGAYDLLSKARVREADLLRKKNKEAKETKRKIEFGDHDAKKPKQNQGRKSEGTQIKTPCKKRHKTHLGVYRDVEIEIDDSVFKIDLIPIVLGVFDIVIGIDWLDRYKANILCSQKLVRVVNLQGREIIIYGDKRKGELKLCSRMKARKYLSRGCQAYMAHVIDISFEKKSAKGVPVVNEFLGFFPEDLSGIPPERQVEFQIDLISGATPIAKTSYRLAPSEMKELMNQLQELLDKGIKVDLAKIEAVMNWQTPKDVGEIRSFLGLTGYYQRFIQDFSKIVSSLTKLTKKNTPFVWSGEQEETFVTLRKKICETPILVLPYGTEDMVVYCDASDVLLCNEARLLHMLQDN
nr:FAR1 DNA binding domain, zinc finger, SWIM-type, MULE transposase domain, FHY3/FAR1 family [Tanacetum cinerariifolium]